MKKRLVAIFMAGALAVASLAGCGSSSSDSSSSSEETTEETEAEAEDSGESADDSESTSDFEPTAWTIAVPIAESGYTPFIIYRTNADVIEEVANGTIINSSSDLTADGVLTFVEQQIAAGVDGLMICPPSDSVLPTVSQLCEEAGVYWGITMRSISDPDIKELVEANPYYVGNCYEDEETAGYICGQWMGEAGYTKIAIFSQTKGDTTTDAREVGLEEACEEYGIEIVGESRGNTQASDITSATESFLAANDDLDAIFYVGTSVTGAQEAIVKAIQDAGRDEVKLVCIDFPEEMVDDFDTGILVYSYAQLNLAYDPYMVTFKLINAIEGYPLDDDGAPTSNNMYMTGVDNAEDAAVYANLGEDYLFYTAEEVESTLLKWNNPDLTESTLQDMIDNYVVQ